MQTAQRTLGAVAAGPPCSAVTLKAKVGRRVDAGAAVCAGLAQTGRGHLALAHKAALGFEAVAIVPSSKIGGRGVRRQRAHDEAVLGPAEIVGLAVKPGKDVDALLRHAIVDRAAVEPCKADQDAVAAVVVPREAAAKPHGGEGGQCAHKVVLGIAVDADKVAVLAQADELRLLPLQVLLVEAVLIAAPDRPAARPGNGVEKEGGRRLLCGGRDRRRCRGGRLCGGGRRQRAL